jgi:heme exporter protein D
MNWGSVGEFLAMGGYGLYVWGSFAMCALVLALEGWTLSARRRALRRLPLDDAGLDERNEFDERPVHES